MVKEPAIGQLSIRANRPGDVAVVIYENRRCDDAKGCGIAASMALRGGIASHLQTIGTGVRRRVGSGVQGLINRGMSGGPTLEQVVYPDGIALRAAGAWTAHHAPDLEK